MISLTDNESHELEPVTAKECFFLPIFHRGYNERSSKALDMHKKYILDILKTIREDTLTPKLKASFVRSVSLSFTSSLFIIGSKHSSCSCVSPAFSPASCRLLSSVISSS